MRERIDDVQDDPKGYYATLGVGREASAAQIKAAYRELAQRWHPDRAQEPEAVERFRRIQEAYEVLRDPLRRMAYDNESRRGSARARGGTAAAPPESQLGREPRGRHGRFAWAIAGLSTLALVGVSAVLGSVLGKLSRLESELDAQLAAAAAPAAPEPAATVAADAFSPTADGTAAMYEVRLRFEPGSAELDARLQQQLAEAVAAFAGVLRELGADARWTLVVESYAPRAASEHGVVVGDWELALLRAAAVIDRLVAAGMPPERLAARFDAGLAANGLAPAELGSVRLALVCCVGRPRP